MKTVLVTGAHGFLSRNVAKTFSQAGYKVYGLGIGTWGDENPADFGIHHWKEASISLEILQELPCRPEIIIHCAGSGSVGFSLSQPYDDFCMTVDTTATVLEYLRTTVPEARFVYPSSAAVYGCGHQGAIIENSDLAPVSPYGVHKLLAENLCQSATRNFGSRCTIIRFFSLYGVGLRKQLLWEACRRLTDRSISSVEFFGTGDETRDWLHVSDAARLIYAAATTEKDAPAIINGGCGHALAVKDVLAMLHNALGCQMKTGFNNQVREGDPQHLQADVQKALELDWQPVVSIDAGIRDYAEWYLNNVK